jgi:hypothetical protein
MPKIKISLKILLFYPEYPKENNKISLKQFKRNFVSKFSGLTPYTIKNSGGNHSYSCYLNDHAFFETNSIQ